MFCGCVFFLISIFIPKWFFCKNFHTDKYKSVQYYLILVEILGFFFILNSPCEPSHHRNLCPEEVGHWTSETTGGTVEEMTGWIWILARASVGASEAAFLGASEVASVDSFLRGCRQVASVGASGVAFGVGWACTAPAFLVGTVPQSLAGVVLGPLGRTERFHQEAGPVGVGPSHPGE